jgi:hypothetical protein
MGRITDKGLSELLGNDSDHWDLIASSRVVTESGVTDLLGDPAVGRSPYSFFNRIKSRENHGAGGPFGTGGDHVGRDLSNKEKPEGLDSRGPNPMRQRKFLGYEFQGMLMFGPDGKPAFHSLWPEGTAPEDRKTLKVNLVTKVPDYVNDPNGTIKPFMDGRTAAFGGKTLNEAFEPVDMRVLEQVQKYAENFEKTFGIKIEISVDAPDDKTHISVMGFRDGDRRLNGFASFPKAMQGWNALKSYGHKPGFMVLNMDNVDAMPDKQVHDLFAHEFGHSIGWAHPHDLASFESLTQREAMEMTTMSYTDLEYRPFGDMKGAELGPMDYGLRKWVHNPPALNAGNGVYDLEKQHRETVKLNEHTKVFQREGILPASPMLAQGQNNELLGTENGDDFIDTNTGYSSQISHPETGAKQKFVLVEGHIDRVNCRGGNNKVVACRSGDQTITTGPGANELQFLYPDLQGQKTIHSNGTDTLVMTTSLLKKFDDMLVDRDGDDVVLRDADNKAAGSIRLTGQAIGKGINTLRVVDELGKTVFEKDVQHLNPESFRRHAIYEAKQVARNHVPEKPDVLPESHEQPRWEDRIKERLRGKGDINEGMGRG